MIMTARALTKGVVGGEVLLRQLPRERIDAEMTHVRDPAPMGEHGQSHRSS